MKITPRLYTLGLLITAISTFAIPPEVPSAGVVERQIEQEYEAHPLDERKDVPSIQIEMPEQTLNIPFRTSIHVRKIEIEDNEAISQQDLQHLIDPYLDQDLTLKEIYKLCHEIDLYYCQQGYFLARTYPPPQEIGDGAIVLKVIEGKLGNVTVEGNEYYSKKFIHSYFTKLQGKTLRYDKFMRALLLLNENSDLRAGAIFEKGKEFGYADVIIRVEDNNPRHLYLNGNNYGRKLTTNTRVGARVDWVNYLVEGDLLSVAEVVGFPLNALYFTDIRYDLPLNRNGTKLELAYLYSGFSIEEFTELGIFGRSKIATIKVKQALVRKRFYDVNLFTSIDFKQIENYSLNQLTSYDALRVLTFGSFFDFYDPCRARNTLTLRMGVGIPNFLGGMPVSDDRSSRPGAGGQFIKFNGDYDFLKRIYSDCFLYFHSSGQYSPSKLTQPEQIYIGGSDTVRGFPLAVALGDSGYYCNLEFRIPPFGGNNYFFKTCRTWKEVLQFCAFLDTGGVIYNSSSQNTYLSGAGIGVKINGPYHLSLSIDVGIPLNHRDLSQSFFTYIKVAGRPF